MAHDGDKVGAGEAVARVEGVVSNRPDDRERQNDVRFCSCKIGVKTPAPSSSGEGDEPVQRSSEAAQRYGEHNLIAAVVSNRGGA